jgi:Protein of unknown function (DUF1524)
MAGEPNADLGGILEDTTLYNLEHVIPLKPSAEWKLQDETVQAYSKRLGNMTLLDPTHNSDFGSDTFEAKRPHYQNSPLLITQNVGKYDEWGPEQIDDRQAFLADRAVKIWVL